MPLYVARSFVSMRYWSTSPIFILRRRTPPTVLIVIVNFSCRCLGWLLEIQSDGDQTTNSGFCLTLKEYQDFIEKGYCSKNDE